MQSNDRRISSMIDSVGSLGLDMIELDRGELIVPELTEHVHEFKLFFQNLIQHTYYSLADVRNQLRSSGDCSQCHQTQVSTESDGGCSPGQIGSNWARTPVI
ncbi:hypothetical protein Zmor_010667 [Zophobas morio]|uniref:Uncharacterized protein n=1 Tax=Zophobas morio TaxID=2755281 RepID=A0AA38MJ03_9CUCU|nr:hypothetical protein Zmor_010667 [Zophobas morio]